jgi:hypothetical protein
MPQGTIAAKLQAGGAGIPGIVKQHMAYFVPLSTFVALIVTVFAD